jgi:hypothetical protein
LSSGAPPRLRDFTARRKRSVDTMPARKSPSAPTAAAAASGSPVTAVSTTAAPRPTRFTGKRNAALR